MESVSEDAPLATESRAGSQEHLVESTRTIGSSNCRALKIAGITTLVCLLLSAQVFIAYMVFDQRQQIQELHNTNQKMEKQMGQHSSEASEKLVMPFGNMHLLNLFENYGKSLKPTTPKPEPQMQLNKDRPSVEEELQNFMKGFEFPLLNQSFLANLQTLKQDLNETSWKSFESWLNYWLLFQMAQKIATQHPASQGRTKCQVEANADLELGLVGSYRPQCDDEGNYRSMQCWSSTRQCWCVDESGTPIEGSKTVGHLDCDKILRSSRTSSDSVEMLDFDDNEA